jgi:hypothetical protein
VREAELQDQIRLALGSDPRVVLWRNNTGVSVSPDGRRTRYGLCVGSSDLIGVLRPSGRFIALEVKTATGRVSPEQARFIALVNGAGGFAAVVRSVADARAAVERAMEGST